MSGRGKTWPGAPCRSTASWADTGLSAPDSPPRPGPLLPLVQTQTVVQEEDQRGQNQETVGLHGLGVPQTQGLTKSEFPDPQRSAVFSFLLCRAAHLPSFHLPSGMF